MLVPDPLAAPEGGWHVAVDCPQWGGPLNATVASWLDGDDVGQCDEEQARALGRTMAVLHDHAEGFALPPGAHLTLFDEPLCHDRNLLEGAVPIPPGHAEVVAESLALLPAPLRRGVCRAAPDRAPRRPARRQPEVARGAPGRLRPRRRRLRGSGARPGHLHLLPARRGPRDRAGSACGLRRSACAARRVRRALRGAGRRPAAAAGQQPAHEQHGISAGRGDRLPRRHGATAARVARHRARFVRGRLR